MTLDQVESFIAENGHLPGIPSAEQVAVRNETMAPTQIVNMQG